MAHLYRGEIYHTKFWGPHVTINWAVLVIPAIPTWAFSRPDISHYIVLIETATLAVFLPIKVRRYPGYDIWRIRVKALGASVFAYRLDPDSGVADPDWRESLSADYRHSLPESPLPSVYYWGTDTA